MPGFQPEFLSRKTFASAALALLAGLAMSTGSPVRAASPDMHNVCKYAAAPQGYGESIRYNNCMRQLDCQAQANRTGQTMFGNGCFGVSPEAPVGGPGTSRR